MKTQRHEKKKKNRSGSKRERIPGIEAVKEETLHHCLSLSLFS